MPKPKNVEDARERMFATDKFTQRVRNEAGEETIIERSFKAEYGEMAESGRAVQLGVDVLNILSNEDDRSLVIVGGAFLDDLLMRVLRKAMIDVVAAKRILKTDGGLGANGNRIDAAEALGLLRADTAAELRRIGTIRNKLAHRFDISSLNDLAGLCDELETHKHFRRDGLETSTLDARNQFSLAIWWSVLELSQALHHASPRTPPPEGPLPRPITL